MPQALFRSAVALRRSRVLRLELRATRGRPRVRTSAADPPEYRVPAAKAAPGRTTPSSRGCGMHRRRTRPAAAPRASLPTLEATDPALRDALAALSAGATSDRSPRGGAAEYLRSVCGTRPWSTTARPSRSTPGTATSYEMRARVWRDGGLPRPGPRRRVSRRLLRAPRSASARNTLGTLLHQLGRYDAAGAQYERALLLDPQAAYALNNLCALAIEQGRPARAGVACRQALAIDPRLESARRISRWPRRGSPALDAEARDARH